MRLGEEPRLLHDVDRALPSVGARRRGVVQVEKGELAWLLTPEGNLQELKVNLKGKKLVGDFRIRHMGQGIYHFERMKRV